MERQKIVDFRDLDVWKLCRDVRQDMWRICKGLPPEEKFRLGDQIVRAPGLQQHVSPRVTADFIIKKTFNSAVNPEGLYMS